MERRKLNEVTRQAIRDIKAGNNMAILSEVQRGQPALIYTSVRLGEILKVSDETVNSWRDQGVIRAKRLHPKLWQYDLWEVLNDLEKYC